MNCMTALRFSLSVQAALVQGAALAMLSSCAGNVSELPDDGTTDTGGALIAGGSPGTGGETATGGSGAGGTSAGGSPSLLPAPSTECVGEDHGDGPGPYYGRCCSDISCRSPGPEGVCLPADSGELTSLPGYPPGSGSCSCEATQGPFAPPADSSHMGEGECCYSIYSIGCDGRPLRREDSSFVLAPVVHRADWGRPAEPRVRQPAAARNRFEL
jgi:hypothetical protein